MTETLAGFLESAVADQNMEEKFELVAGAREGVGVGRRAKGAMGSAANMRMMGKRSRSGEGKEGKD